MRSHRWKPTRLPSPWDSPGKSTGVGCHCLLQCMKVKSESEVALSCPTLSDPMDCSLPGSSIQGIIQARVLEWGAIAFSESWLYKGILKGTKEITWDPYMFFSVPVWKSTYFLLLIRISCLSHNSNFSHLLAATHKKSRAFGQKPLFIVEWDLLCPLTKMFFLGDQEL